jgi:hypothetical protein
MGVDFFPCDRCGESICDCGPYERCNDMCGRRWCDRNCAKEDGYDSEDDRSCNFCRLEDVEDSPLLHFLLKEFNLSLEEAKKRYLAWAREQENGEEETDES